MYYIFLENEKLNGCGECKCLTSENIEVEQEIYEDYIKTPNKYTWEEKEVEVPIYENQEVELVDFDEDGNEIGTHFETEQIITGYENKTIKVIVLNPDYEKEEEEKHKQEEITELKLELDNLDLKTIRALRAINAGASTPDDELRLKTLEQQAKEIRERIAELSNAD